MARSRSSIAGSRTSAKPDDRDAVPEQLAHERDVVRVDELAGHAR